jgi:hypothetical protein
VFLSVHPEPKWYRRRLQIPMRPSTKTKSSPLEPSPPSLALIHGLHWRDYARH